jgi:hypothetical protein
MAIDYVLCRTCGGSGLAKLRVAPNYHAQITSLTGGRLALVCVDEANARPWVNLLLRAGVRLEHAERCGVYLFNFEGVEELVTTRTPAELRPFYWLDDAAQASASPAGA